MGPYRKEQYKWEHDIWELRPCASTSFVIRTEPWWVSGKQERSKMEQSKREGNKLERSRKEQSKRGRNKLERSKKEQNKMVHHKTELDEMVQNKTEPNERERCILLSAKYATRRLWKSHQFFLFSTVHYRNCP